MLFFPIAENPPSLIAEGIFCVFVRRERENHLWKGFFVCCYITL